MKVHVHIDLRGRSETVSNERVSDAVLRRIGEPSGVAITTATHRRIAKVSNNFQNAAKNSSETQTIISLTESVGEERHRMLASFIVFFKGKNVSTLKSSSRHDNHLLKS